jgi:hypothetical protein
MKSDRDWSMAIRKLIVMTQEDQIHWSTISSVKRDSAVGPIYKTTTEGRAIAVYKYRYRYFTEHDEFEWNEDVAIEFVGIDGEWEWKWPGDPLASELLDAIMAQVAHAHEFFDRFVAKE